MKRIIYMIFAVCTVLMITSCGETKTPGITPTPTESKTPDKTPAASQTSKPTPSVTPKPFEGKIAILTGTLIGSEEEYYSAQQLVAKYGEDKVVHITWPDGFETEAAGFGLMSDLFKLWEDPELRVIVINPALPGSNAMLDKLNETRKDIFVVYCNPKEHPADVTERAQLVLIPDELSTGTTMVQQAAKMGANVFIHYSFPRHLSQILLSAKRELAKQECAKLGIEFVDAEAPDPLSDFGMIGAQQFILDDVPKMIAQYGKNTAFFATDCSMQAPLIKAVVDGGAIYPQPCHLHGFPEALGFESGDMGAEGNAMRIIEQTREILKEKGELGRISTWPVSTAMLSTDVGVEYAIKWINGEVSKDVVDQEALKQLMEGYAGVSVDVRPYTDGNGKTCETFLMFFMDYMIY